MSKFFCYYCGKEFDYPDSIEEFRGEYGGVPAYERVWMCPNCKSESIGEQEEDYEDASAV